MTFDPLRKDFNANFKAVVRSQMLGFDSSVLSGLLATKTVQSDANVLLANQLISLCNRSNCDLCPR